MSLVIMGRATAEDTQRLTSLSDLTTPRAGVRTRGGLGVRASRGYSFGISTLEFQWGNKLLETELPTTTHQV